MVALQQVPVSTSVTPARSGAISVNADSESGDAAAKLQLMEMGFAEADVNAALRASNGDTVVALEYLMSGL